MTPRYGCALSVQIVTGPCNRTRSIAMLSVAPNDQAEVGHLTFCIDSTPCVKPQTVNANGRRIDVPINAGAPQVLPVLLGDFT
jgi:hypothetical protein